MKSEKSLQLHVQVLNNHVKLPADASRVASIGSVHSDNGGFPCDGTMVKPSVPAQGKVRAAYSATQQTTFLIRCLTNQQLVKRDTPLCNVLQNCSCFFKKSVVKDQRPMSNSFNDQYTGNKKFTGKPSSSFYTYIYTHYTLTFCSSLHQLLHDDRVQLK